MSRRKKNLRLLIAGAPSRSARAEPVVPHRSPAAFWCRTATTRSSTTSTLKVVTKRAPSARELADMRFAWRVAKHVKSNAIVYAKDGATVGIGAGQMSRVDSSRVAARKAEDAAQAAGLAAPLTKGSVVASDAFFPFADGLLAAARGRRRPRSSSPAAPCATTKSSPPPTRRDSRWCSPACAISGTEAARSEPPRGIRPLDRAERASIGRAPRVG